MTDLADMPEYRGFLARVCEDPADDTARLVFADWLDENGGGARAEIIRRMCANRSASARVVWVHNTPPQHRDLWTNGVRFPGYRRAFLALVPGRGEFPSLSEMTFRRGFPEELRCPADAFLAHADALLWHPRQDRPCPATAVPVTRVTLTTPANWYHCDGTVVLQFGWSGAPFVGLSHYALRRVKSGDAVGDPAAGRAYLRGLLEAEWPGVAFDVPEPVEPPWWAEMRRLGWEASQVTVQLQEPGPRR